MKVNWKSLFLLTLGFNFFLLVCLFLLVNRLGGWRYFLYRLQNNGISALYEHRKSLFQKLPNRTGEIIFLGDSLTEGGEWGEFFESAAVKNRGIARDGTQGVLDRLMEVLESKPSKIFLLIGVNDFFQSDVSTTFSRYEKIVAQILKESPNTQLYLQSLLPVNNDIGKLPFDNEMIDQLNKEIRQLSLTKNIPFIDIYPHLLDPNGQLAPSYTLDGLHLNGEGYFVWKNAVEPYLKSN